MAQLSESNSLELRIAKAADISNVDVDELAGGQPGQEPMRFFERLKAAASAEWRVYTEHPFTDGMADGLLVEEAFRHYLVQDYLFLIEFARAYALAVYKSPKLADMRSEERRVGKECRTRWSTTHEKDR